MYEILWFFVRKRSFVKKKMTTSLNHTYNVCGTSHHHHHHHHHRDNNHDHHSLTHSSAHSICPYTFTHRRRERKKSCVGRCRRKIFSIRHIIIIQTQHTHTHTSIENERNLMTENIFFSKNKYKKKKHSSRDISHLTPHSVHWR